MFQSNKRYFNVGSSIWFELTICWDNIIVSFAFRFSAFYSIIRLFLVISKTLRNIKWQTLQKQKRTKIELKVWQERGKKIDCVRKMKVLSLKIKKKKSQLFSVSIFDKIRLAHTHTLWYQAFVFDLLFIYFFYTILRSRRANFVAWKLVQHHGSHGVDGRISNEMKIYTEQEWKIPECEPACSKQRWSWKHANKVECFRNWINYTQYTWHMAHSASREYFGLRCVCSSDCCVHVHLHRWSITFNWYLQQ